MNQPSASRVSRELRGHLFLIGLDRVAKRNAFDLELLNQLSLASVSYTHLTLPTTPYV